MKAKLEMSWEEIQKALNAGEKFSVGDYKTEVLKNGQLVTLVVTNVQDDCFGDEKLYEQLEYYKDQRNRMRGSEEESDSCGWWLASVWFGSSTRDALLPTPALSAIGAPLAGIGYRSASLSKNIT